MDAINSIGDLFNIFEELYSYLKITSNIRHADFCSLTAFTKSCTRGTLVMCTRYCVVHTRYFSRAHKILKSCTRVTKLCAQHN